MREKKNEKLLCTFMLDNIINAQYLSMRYSDSKETLRIDTKKIKTKGVN